MTCHNYMVEFKNSTMNISKALSPEEWKEIMGLPEIKDSWGQSGDETLRAFSDMAYGVKFAYSPMTMPGYAGDLYIISGDALGEPFNLIRKDGNLAPGPEPDFRYC